MEINFNLKSFDNKTIYGVLHKKADNNKSVLLMIHGLTGSMNQYCLLTLARSLSSADYDVLRFNLYDGNVEGRKLEDATISLNVKDILEVLGFLKQSGYKKVFVVGHSLGAVLAIYAANRIQTEFLQGLILLDPTDSPEIRINQWDNKDIKLGFSFIHTQMKVYISKEWIEDAKNSPNSYNEISEIKCPLLVITAEKGGLTEISKKYLENLNGSFRHVIIENADHGFNKEGNIQKLVNEIEDFVIKT